MKAKTQILPLLALASFASLSALAPAQGPVIYEDNEIDRGVGFVSVQGGDGDIESHGLMNVPYNTVSVDVSYWQVVAQAGSRLKIQVYDLNAGRYDPPYSETVLYPTANEQLSQGLQIPVPRNRNFSIRLRASCDQFQPSQFRDATYTYNRIFRISFPTVP